MDRTELLLRAEDDGLLSEAFDGKALDELLRLSSLTGMVSKDLGLTSLHFSGQDVQGVEVSLTARFSRDGALRMKALTVPPCCDLFAFELEAAAVESAD